MKTIAVVCALPPTRNTGMATVDLAAFSVIRRLAPFAQITLYVYGKIADCAYRPGELPFPYVSVEESPEAYFASDAFVFWGDFTHSLSYWHIDRATTAEECNSLSGAELEEWKLAHWQHYSRFVFLTDTQECRLNNVLVFGGTIITNDAESELNTLYFNALTRLFVSAGGVFCRDALSAAKVSPLRSDEATLACDCALLLEDADLTQVDGFTQATTRTGVGVFFVRSPCRIRMMIFSRLVGWYLGEKCFWLPWLAYVPNRRRKRWPLLAFGYYVRSGDAALGTVLTALSGYRCIVTDTYHLCVNAWRMGIPAVCIGEGAVAAKTSLSDKKKEVLYEMYGARQYYVFVETLKSTGKLLSEAKRVSAVVREQAMREQVCCNIAKHRKMAVDRLRRFLNKSRVSN